MYIYIYIHTYNLVLVIILIRMLILLLLIITHVKLYYMIVHYIIISPDGLDGHRHGVAPRAGPRENGRGYIAKGIMIIILILQILISIICMVSII